MEKQQIFLAIKNYFADKPVNKVSVFGSFAKNKETKNSDIDILIEYDKPVGLFTLGRYVSDLEDITSKKVDIATLGMIRPEFLAEINNDLQIIYARG